ncbi:uracil-DNA glycosylase family protein, partial [Neisseria sp. P0015.S004]
MLSSRFLHLNEALGLGPMWLNQNDKIIHAAPLAATSAAPVRPKTIAADT